MTSINDYYDGMQEIIDHSGNPDIFKISPSSVADFFTHTSQYYREQVEGEDKAFQGSTSTHLGTVVHAIAEATAKDESLDNSSEMVQEFLDSITDTDIDKSVIESLWAPMSHLLVQNAVTAPGTEIVGTEEFNFHKLNDDVYVGGTFDSLIVDKAVQGGLCVVDYKTAATKPSGINQKYRLQAYCYCYMLKEQGKNITSFQLSFVTRPTKTLPVRYFEFKEQYTEENHEYIGKILQLIADSVSMYKSDPELRKFLAQDITLTPATPMVAFPTI